MQKLTLTPRSDLHSSWSGVRAALYSLSGSPGDADVQPLLDGPLRVALLREGSEM